MYGVEFAYNKYADDELARAFEIRRELGFRFLGIGCVFALSKNLGKLEDFSKIREEFGEYIVAHGLHFYGYAVREGEVYGVICDKKLQSGRVHKMTGYESSCVWPREKVKKVILATDEYKSMRSEVRSPRIDLWEY